jgi:hypothetical protein
MQLGENMKDMIEQEINPGDFFLLPGGNARYGGLVLEIGVVLSHGNKMMKTLITRFDKIKPKPTNKTSVKVLKIELTEELKKQEAVIKLLELYQTYER